MQAASRSQGKWGNMFKQKFGLAACAVTLAASSAPAFGQAWIGQVVGQMAAQQAAAAQEAACRQGTPASDKTQAWALSSSEEAMAAYLQLSPSSKPSALGKVFALKREDASWKGPDGTKVPLTQVSARLEGPKPKLERTAFVVAGDGTSARGIWKATWAEQPDRVAWYAVDLVGGPGKSMWGGGGYRIWHFTHFEGGEAPAAPAAYCHYDPDQAW